MAKKEIKRKTPQFVLTIRIDEDLDNVIEELKEIKETTKAKIIKDYLEMAKYVKIDERSVRSMNNNELIFLKRTFFKKIIEGLEEIKQIDLGSEIARFINDIARGQDQLDNIIYKLDLCQHFGLFHRYVDRSNYILFSKSFGPQKFVEAFVWQLITKGDQGDFELSFTTNEIKGSKSNRSNYEKKIQPVHRDGSYYAFGFAKIEK